MEIISLFVEILSLCVGVLAFGYQIGKDICGDDCDRHEKKNSRSRKNGNDKTQK